MQNGMSGQDSNKKNRDSSELKINGSELKIGLGLGLGEHASGNLSFVGNRINHESKLEDKKSARSEKLIAEQKLGKRPPKEAFQHMRLKKIEELIDLFYNEFLSHLQKAAGKEAEELYRLMGRKQFPQLGDAIDGWEEDKIIHITRFASKGRDWENEIQQAKDIKRLKGILFCSQLNEIFFAGTTFYMSIHDFANQMQPAVQGVVYTLLTFQTILSAFINYNSIDRIKGSQDRIRPILQIGNSILDGTTVRSAKPTDNPTFSLKINPQFDPSSEKYNRVLVSFYNHALRLFLEEQKNYRKSEYKNTMNAFFNRFSYPITNYFAASINWLIINQILNFFTTAGAEPWHLSVPGLLLLVPITYTGVAYYKEFTQDSIKICIENAFTTENPLSQIGRLSSAQRREMIFQWFLNGAARGISIALGIALVYEAILAYYADYFTPPAFIKFALLTVAGLMGAHNTWLSRMKGAQAYLAPFRVKGPMGDIITVPNEALLEFNNSLSTVRLSTREKRMLLLKPILFGLFIGGSVGIGVAILTTATRFPTWAIFTASSASALICFAGTAYNNYLAEFKHALHQNARENIENQIKDGQKNKEEAKSKYDANGNPKLTAEGPRVFRFNLFLNVLDQLGRAQSRAGTIGGLLLYLIDSEAHAIAVWGIPLAINLAALIPQLNELHTYAQSTIDQVLDIINSVRELAGTPANSISGYGVSNFCARQAVCFLPFIFGREIAGISDVTWRQWFSTRGGPVLSIDTDTDEEKGELSSAPHGQNNRSLKRSLLASGSETPARTESESWSLRSALGYLFCCCRNRPTQAQRGALSLQESKTNKGGAYYSRLN